MDSKKLMIGLSVLVLVVVGAAIFVTSQNNTGDFGPTEVPNPKEMEASQGQEEELSGQDPSTSSGQEAKSVMYTGKLVAGSTTPYLDFTKRDYDKAIGEGKVVVLNFYANWCPICRAEAPDLASGFDSLNNPNVVAFRVNYKDSETDPDEAALAKQFSIPYQHTKVILKNGTQVYKETVQWSREDLVSEIKKVL